MRRLMMPAWALAFAFSLLLAIPKAFAEAGPPPAAPASKVAGKKEGKDAKSKNFKAPKGRKHGKGKGYKNHKRGKKAHGKGKGKGTMKGKGKRKGKGTMKGKGAMKGKDRKNPGKPKKAIKDRKKDNDTTNKTPSPAHTGEGMD